MAYFLECNISEVSLFKYVIKTSPNVAAGFVAMTDTYCLIFYPV